VLSLVFKVASPSVGAFASLQGRETTGLVPRGCYGQFRPAGVTRWRALTSLRASPPIALRVKCGFMSPLGERYASPTVY